MTGTVHVTDKTSYHANKFVHCRVNDAIGKYHWADHEGKTEQ